MASLNIIGLADLAPQGVHGRYDFPALLVHAARHRNTGRLTFKAGKTTRIVVGYREGTPCFTASSVQEEQLGHVMLSNNVVTPAQVVEIDALMQREKIQFGRAATKLGFCTKQQLTDCLALQRVGIITKLFRLKQTTVSFDEAGSVPQKVSAIPLLQLIETGVREYGDDNINRIDRQLREYHFVVSAADAELVEKLGGSESVVEMARLHRDVPGRYEDMLALSEDDNPAVPAMTLVLSALATVAQSEGAARSTESASSLAEVDDMLAGLNAAPSAESASSLSEIDEMLASLKKGKSASGASRAKAPRKAPPADTPDVPSDEPPAAEPNGLSEDLFDLDAHPHQSDGAAAAAPNSSTGSAQGLAATDGQAGLPPGVVALPSTTGEVPLLGHPSTGPITGVPITGVPGQTGVPNAVYAVVPRELLAQTSKKSQSGLFFFLGVLILVLGVGAGAGVVLFVKPQVTSSDSAEAATTTAESDDAPAANEEGAATTAESGDAPDANENSEDSAGVSSDPSDPKDSKPAPSAKATASKPRTTSKTARSPPKKTTTTPKKKHTPAAPTTSGKADKQSNEEIAFRMSMVQKFLQKHDFRKVLSLCQEVLKLNPRHAGAYRSMAVAYSGLGAKPQACESYRRYLRFNAKARDRAQVEAILKSCN